MKKKELKDHQSNLNYKMRQIPDGELKFQLQEKKLAMLEEEKVKHEKKDRGSNYAKYVKETYWPSVSVKK